MTSGSRPHATAGSFTVEWLDRIEGRPEYLRMIWLTYLLGFSHERWGDAWAGWRCFWVLLVGGAEEVSAESRRRSAEPLIAVAHYPG